jgi:D-alanyl-D-alanine dipeptidase
MLSRLGVAALIAIATLGSPAAGQALPPGFVYLRDIDSSIAQDIRYAGPNNFIGRALSGYDAAECVLRDVAARALAAVQVALVARGLGLKLYDCYRPQRAVHEMVHWARALGSSLTDEHFYPRVPRSGLLAQGYIAEHSSHSTGLAVDATLMAQSTTTIGSAGGPCSGPADDSLDMGTSFDCFDPRSYSADAAIGVEPKRRRALLIAAMKRHGFANYRHEWWHFTFFDRLAGPASFDFPIVARPAR